LKVFKVKFFGTIQVWEEDKESPIVEIPQPYSYEQLGKKLFGKENPASLDAVKRVLKRKQEERRLRNY